MAVTTLTLSRSKLRVKIVSRRPLTSGTSTNHNKKQPNALALSVSFILTVKTRGTIEALNSIRWRTVKRCRGRRQINNGTYSPHRWVFHSGIVFLWELHINYTHICNKLATSLHPEIIKRCFGSIRSHISVRYPSSDDLSIHWFFAKFQTLFTIVMVWISSWNSIGCVEVMCRICLRYCLIKWQVKNRRYLGKRLV
jgi:hypothetical protein